MTHVSKFTGAASVLIAASLACLSAPAFAAEAEGNSATQASAAMTAAAPAPRAEKKYCVTEALTGSRMPTKVCRTKAGWLAEGVDVSKTK